MPITTMRKRKPMAKEDKSPYNRRSEKIDEKAFKSVNKSVKPVARDTNKTRRANTKARRVGPTVKVELPVSRKTNY